MRDASLVLVFFVLSVVVIVVVALVLRHRREYMVHQERMAAIDKGAPIPSGPEPAPWSPRVFLLRGLIWSFSGVAVVIALLGISWATVRTVQPSAVWVAQDSKAVSERLGIPIDQARQMVEKDQAAETRGMPVGVAVLGVLPLAVGLAYLVFYYTDESRKRTSSGIRP